VTPNKPKERKFSVKFDNFEELPSERGHRVGSSTFSCFGHEWRVDIYPGGYKDSLDGMVGVYLNRVTTFGKRLNIEMTIGVKSEDDIDFKGNAKFGRAGAWGWIYFPARSILLEEFLEEGALTIYASLRLQEFIPNNPASSIILKLFRDEKSADVVFEISEKQKSGNESETKRAKVASANFYAHRFILQHHSPELAALCATSQGMTPILINDVKSDVFRHLLYYVYGGDISEEEFKTYAKDLINAADKYGVTNLKLEAEVWYVHHTEITFDNVIDNLLYADAMNCALLKETVMDFIAENKKKMQKVSFDNVPGNACKDLLAAMSRRYQDDDCGGGDDDEEDNVDFDKLRIGELRKKVQEKGLEIDGSRAALIAALKEHS
jgi:hypothetical protein